MDADRDMDERKMTMSWEMCYSRPPVHKFKDSALKKVQIRPRKRVKLAVINYSKLRMNFKQQAPLNPVVFPKMMYNLRGKYFRFASYFLRLRSFLRNHFKIEAASFDHLNYLRLNQTRENRCYQRLTSGEHVKSRKQQTLTLDKNKRRLYSFRKFRLRLKCLSPRPFLKELIYVMSLNAASDVGQSMSQHATFPVT
ncbi:hypothetical protein O6H91_17G079200 [Diphasiastrum complanatum]|uniref:Uncharacterized protein n=1 Tax=Diphasiastrum complanatum TaxID=34168 RepID=A0ACC2B8K7_DIPCM|nr:hypothetical protein O6H91_17G079200 [Diphasiastrum complanatum]